MAYTKNEGNGIIAVFDGKLAQIDTKGRLLLSDDGGKCYYGVLYDQDWSELMKVVEKIEDIIKPNSWYESDKVWFEIKSHSANIHCKLNNKTFNCLWVIVKGYSKDHRGNVVATKREAVWHCVVDFLQWYNRVK